MKLRFKNDCTDESCNLNNVAVPGQGLFAEFGTAKRVTLVIAVQFTGLELFGELLVKMDTAEANSLAYRILRMTGEMTTDEIYGRKPK